MQNKNLTSNILNNEIDNFKDFFSEFEVIQLYPEITNYPDYLIPGINQTNFVKNTVTINNFSIEKYNCFINELLNNTVKEIIDNITQLSYNYIHAFHYLLEIQKKSGLIDLDFETTCMDIIKNVFCKENEFNSDTSKSKFNHMIESKIEEFILSVKGCIKKLLGFINQCFNMIDNTNFSPKFMKNFSFPKETITKAIKPTMAYSFKYDKLFNTTAFNGFFNSLCDNNFLERKKTSVIVFKCIFSNQQIKTQVVWHGGVLSLRYLIRTLRDKKLIEYPINSQLNLVRICFKLHDNKPINKNSFNSKISVNEKIINQLDKAIECLLK